MGRKSRRWGISNDDGVFVQEKCFNPVKPARDTGSGADGA